MAASEQTQEISVVHCVEKWCFGHLAQPQACLSWLSNIMLNLLTKNFFDILLLFKLKHAFYI